MSIESLGEVRRKGETYELVFERRVAKPIEKVWAALTTPERLADWLAEAEIDPRVGGRITLHWIAPDYRMTGTITEFDPPRLLAWTWPHEKHPGSVVRWELQPDGDGCRLRLTQTALTDGCRVEVAAGWHTHLELLPPAVDGVAMTWKAGRERELAKLYEAALLT